MKPGVILLALVALPLWPETAPNQETLSAKPDLLAVESRECLEKAAAHLRLSEYSQAEYYYRHALEMNAGKRESRTLVAVEGLAAVMFAQGRYTEAEPFCSRSLTILEKVLGRDDPTVAYTLIFLAEIRRRTLRYVAAEPLLGRAIYIFERGAPTDHHDLVVALNDLGVLYTELGYYDRAAKLLERALAIERSASGCRGPMTAGLLRNLGMAYLLSRQYPKAESALRESLRIAESSEVLDAYRRVPRKFRREQAARSESADRTR